MPPQPRASSSPQPDHPAQYVLGTGRDELDRLGFQHRLWSDAAHGLWRQAGIAIGQRVLDVGCGPGFASFDMAQIVGLEGDGTTAAPGRGGGCVVGVDESASYVAYYNDQAEHRGLHRCSAVVGDVQNLPGVLRSPPSGSARAATSHFDLAYARWVLCFVPRPEDVVAGVGAALKTGGRFCVHDYFNYNSMTMAPKRPSHDRAVAATIASWQARGGDTDIMGRLPRILKDHGFRVDHIGVHQRIARGRDTMFHWPDVWWRIYAPKLVQMGFLAKEDQEQLFRDLEEIAHSDTDFIVAPPVYEIIATKL
ncbi:MAG: class I SAM-dependent methyltransferase [Pyrinomonadaceae bacterium]|nr:class I SAM-dependent methyltransferase [Phycisphaerales bacterium]